MKYYPPVAVLVLMAYLVGMLLAVFGGLIHKSLSDMAAQKNYTLHFFWLGILTMGFFLFFCLGDLVKLYLGLF